MWFLWCCVCWFSQPHHVCWYRTGHRCRRCQTTTAWRPASGEGSPQLRTEQPSSPCWSQTREEGERREKALVWRPLQLIVWTQGWSFFLDYDRNSKSSQWVERLTEASSASTQSLCWLQIWSVREEWVWFFARLMTTGWKSIHMVDRIRIFKNQSIFWPESS